MALVVNYIWGGSGRTAKAGLGRVLDAILDVGQALHAPAGPADPTVQICSLVSGDAWQHHGEGFTVEPVTTRGRDWLKVTIYVPDALAEEEQSVAFFRRTLAEVSDAVEARLKATRPDWPIDELVGDIFQLDAKF